MKKWLSKRKKTRVCRRVAKKIAKRYLDGGNVQRYLMGVDEYPDGTGNFRADAVFPKRIYAAICAEAYRRGWDGFYLDSPFLIYAGTEGGTWYGYASRMHTSLHTEGKDGFVPDPPPDIVSSGPECADLDYWLARPVREELRNDWPVRENK